MFPVFIQGNPSANKLLGTSLQKTLRTFGVIPARTSAFISVSILLNTEVLTGFAMPARTSAFDRF